VVPKHLTDGHGNAPRGTMAVIGPGRVWISRAIHVVWPFLVPDRNAVKHQTVLTETDCNAGDQNKTEIHY
jgi:hypothetical protein